MSPAELKEHESQTALPPPPAQKLLEDPEEHQGPGFRKWIILLIVLAAVGAAVWKIRKNSQETTTQSGRQAAAADRAIPVTTQAVEQKSMPIYLTALGTVTAYNTVTIKSRVDGQLLTVNVREGQSVRKGQPLAKIDPAPFAAAVAQAEGTLIKDQATAANADAQATRYKALLEAGVVSKESEQAQASSAGQAQGSIAADQAAIQAAKVNLAYTTITSPIDGVVGLRQVDAGNIVHAGDTTGLLVVTQLQPIAVIFTLPEDQLPQVQALIKGGQSLQVEAYDRSDTTMIGTGKLLTLDNQIDTTTGTVKVKAVFDNKDGALFPNQFVNVRLILQERQNAIVIPAAALQTGSQGSFVYVVKPGQPPADPDAPARGAGGGAGGGRRARGAGAAAGAGAGAAGSGAPGGADAGPPADPYYVEARPVKVDLTEGAQVILASGAAKGELVVIDGQEKLRNLAKVSPKDANAPPGGGGRGGRNRGGAGSTGAGAAGGAGAAQTPGTQGQKGATGTGSHGDGTGGAGTGKPGGGGAGGDSQRRHRDGGSSGGGGAQP